MRWPLLGSQALRAHADLGLADYVLRDSDQHLRVDRRRDEWRRRCSNRCEHVAQAVGATDRREHRRGTRVALTRLGMELFVEADAYWSTLSVDSRWNDAPRDGLVQPVAAKNAERLAVTLPVL